MNKILTLFPEEIKGGSLKNLLTSETTDDQLRQLANRLCLRLDGIVFKDELSKLPKLTEPRNYSYIIHLREPAHWTALMCDNRTHRAYYYNSFADHFGDIPQDLLDFCKKNKLILYSSDKPIQLAQVGNCGQFAVLYLSYLNRPTNDVYDFNQYLSKFKDVTEDILRYKEKHKDLNY
jgi:hypothetical protein